MVGSVDVRMSAGVVLDGGSERSTNSFYVARTKR